MGLIGEIYADVSIHNKINISAITSSLKQIDSTVTNTAASFSTGFTNKIQTGLTSAGTSIEGFSKKFKGLSTASVAAAGYISAQLTRSLLGMGAASTTAYQQFDDSMRKVQAVTGATVEDLSSLSAFAKTAGADLGYGAIETANAMGILGQAGFQANQIYSVLPATLQLARAGVLDIEDAADITAQAITIFGLSVNDASHVADVFAKVANMTNTSVEELGTAMTYTGPVAHTFGLSMEMAAAATGLLSNAGIKGSMAGTTLRGILQELVAPTQKTRDTFASVGLTMDQLNPKVHSLDEIFRTLRESGLTDAQMFEIFGQRAGPGFAALLSQGTDALGNMGEGLKNVDGYAKTAAEQMNAGFGGAVRELKANLELLKISLGEDIAAIITPVINVVSYLAKAFTELPDPIQKTVIVLGGLAVVGLGIVAAISTLGFMISGVSLAFSTLGITAAGVAGAITGIGIPVLAVVGFLYVLERETGLVSAAWQLFKDLFTITAYGIMDAAGILRDFIVQKVEEIKQSLAGMIPESWVSTISTIWNGITTQFSNAGTSIHATAEGVRQDHNNIGTSAQTTAGQVTTASGQMQTGFANTGLSALTMGSNTLTATGQMVTGFGNAGSNALTMGANTQTATGMMTNGFNTAGGAALTMGGNIGSTVSPVNTLSGAVQAGVVANQKYSASFIDVSRQASAAASAAISAVNKIGSAIKTNISQVGELEALAGKWNTRAKLGVTSSGGSGTGEGNVKVKTPANQMTASETASRVGNNTVYNNNKNTVNNNGDKLSASRAKAAGA